MSVTVFKTAKGTELPFLNLRGKDYLQVAHRLVWFREEKPGWSIVTETVQITDTYAIFKASIIDETGRVIATAHKREDKAHFADFIEKAETAAIGRAVALVGYGTQFAEELEEGERIVDSPTVRAKSASGNGNGHAVKAPEPETPHRSGVFCEACGEECIKHKSGAGYLCPQWTKKGDGHTHFKIEQLAEMRAKSAKQWADDAAL